MAKKAEFVALFPEYETYLRFNSPNFSVRVGDFRNKSEALKAYKRIHSSFPRAYIVEDLIDFPSFNTSENE
jgi:hypothetical protein